MAVRFRYAIVITAIWLVAGTLQASTIVESVTFDQPEITRLGQVCSVSIEGLPLVGEEGQPLLPAYGMEVLLPQGEAVASVKARVLSEETIQLDLPIEWAQPQAPLSRRDQFEPIGSNSEIYGSDRPFPQSRVKYVTTQTFRGYNIAFFRVYPLQYRGSRHALVFAREVEIEIETTPSEALYRRSLQTLRSRDCHDAELVSRFVRNADAVETYEAHPANFTLLSQLVDPQDTYPYVIIVHSNFINVLETLRAHKERLGLGAKIVHTGQINFNYSGADIQEKIRNFIRDAYLNWGTEYILLAGDTSSIPARGFYAKAGSDEDDDIASDLYYAALDGTWNDDGDSLWGEPDEADLIPEVSVGRISIDDSTQAANFINKLIKYETQPVVSQIKTAEMVGELLWDDPTWGGDYKDEIKDGTSAHGYTTVGFPPTFTVNTLYDRDLDPDRWDKEDLIPILNGGCHIVNHLGHSDVTYGLRMYNSDVDTRFTNDGISNTYFIVYTQGCYSGSFDNRNAGGGYIGDCLGEHFTYVENAAVAFIGNTRYGWGAHQSTRGANQYYDRQFFDAIFGENITEIGKANDDSRVDNIPFIDLGPNRWVYYELVLLGDPAMDIWTDVPDTLTLARPDVIYVGENQVELTVTSGGQPVEGARVSIFSANTYNCGYTASDGKVYLDPIATEPGSLFVAVKAHNFYSLLDTIPVMNPTDALVVIDHVTTDDDSFGKSLGNGDGKCDAGETIEVMPTLKNAGADTAFGVSGLLSTPDAFVTVVDTLASYGDIAPDSMASPPSPYVFTISPDVPDSHTVAFDLAISHTDTLFVKHFSVRLSAPDLRIASIQSSDSLYGNGDGCLEPGESFEIVPIFVNRGSGVAAGVTFLLDIDDPYVTISQDSSYIDLLSSGDSAGIDPPFLVSVDPECPEFYELNFRIDIGFESGRAETESLVLYLGGSVSDDFESGSPGWTHSDLGDGYVEEWHLDTYRNHTPGGGYAWKFGGEDSLRYSDYAHGVLVTPDVCLGPNATLTFWHWIHAELQNGTYAWDGGIVEISTDGGETWSQIEPVGGYPYVIYPNDASPFDPNTPCFAWTDDWTQVEFDLSGYQGQAKIRFRFGSDGYAGGEGWYIDDVMISDDYASVEITEMEIVPVRFALRSVAPNPLTCGSVVSFDVPRRSSVRIDLYDVNGRLVANLADGVYEPGRYSRSIGQASKIASGVYFLRMEAQSYQATTKVVVIR